MADSKKSQAVTEHSVHVTTPARSTEEPFQTGKRTKSTTFLFQVFCIVWLIPIIALLYLNFSNHIIGPSAWCAGGDSCALDPFSPAPSVTEGNIKRFNRNNRNLLGILQLVAKLLEIWFVVIAGALLFLITMRLASKPGGLPLGYLTRSRDFPGIGELLDPLMWTSGGKGMSKRNKGAVWCLLGVSILLALLCNLMGPATAILAIPTLQWITTKSIGDHFFVGLNAAEPPQADLSSWFATYQLTSWSSAAKGCNPNKFAAQHFACTMDPLGFALDKWLDDSLASHASVGSANFVDQFLLPLTFTVNATWTASANPNMLPAPYSDVFKDYVWWVPSRQVISNLSLDVNTFGARSQGIEISDLRQAYAYYSLYHDDLGTYNEYNKSLGLEIQRNGPLIGFVPTMWVGKGNVDHYTLDVGQERYLRCYENYDVANVPYQHFASHAYYTKCIRLGGGWSNANKNVSFTVPGYYNARSGDQEPDIAVDIYSSDRAAFFLNGELPAWLPSKCLQNTTASSYDCDWEYFFDEGESSNVANRTRNVITVEFKMNNGTNAVTWAVDFVAFLGFSIYSIDPSRITNPSWLIKTGELPLTGSSIAIDPSWLLAGFSANKDGQMDTQRTSTSLIQQVMSAIMKYQRMDATLEVRLKTHLLGFIPIAHSMSLIDHQLTTTPQSSWPNDEHPLMQRNARMYIWGYFLGSRTSFLGAVVVIGGIVVVLLQAYLGFADRRRYYGPIELLASALQHMPQGEFDGKQSDEKAIAKMRFQIEDKGGQLMYSPR